MKARYFLLFIGLVVSFASQAQTERSRTVTLMGSRFDITLVDKDSVSCEQNIDLAIAEISRIEYLISDWKESTLVSEINRNAGIKPVVVTAELFDLTSQALFFSTITAGAFDISFAAMDKIWRFDGTMKEMPSAEQVKKSIALVNYRDIVLDSIQQSIFLKNKGMKISFGSIGKAYAADKARELLEKKGVKSGIIGAAGDVTTWGLNKEGKPWKIGITNPFDDENFIAIVALQRQAIVTSGSYEKFVEFGGVRYSHIINPSTGYPSKGLISVTIMGPNASIANGLSTSIMVLGLEKSLKLMQQFPLYSGVFVTDAGKVVKTKNFPFKIKRRIK
jgi:thiamine biosynthesis lipoprotein